MMAKEVGQDEEEATEETNEKLCARSLSYSSLLTGGLNLGQLQSSL